VLRAYLRLVVFGLGLLLGIQAPAFIDQYANRVSAHYSEAAQNFAGFQRTADLNFGGSVEALIAHHAASEDPAFRDEAQSVAAVFSRVQRFALEVDAMRRSLLSRILHVAFRPDKEILHETLAAYSYTVPLTEEAILCGLGGAVLLALPAELLLLGVLRIGRSAIGLPRSSRA
jgi:hypothetical protein